VQSAFNVLRQYDESAGADAWAQMMAQLLPGGLLIEGTSDPLGRFWVANVIRKEEEGKGGKGEREKGREGVQIPHSALRIPHSSPGNSLVFSTNFRTGFDPAEFQERLPKNLIHHVVEGEWIYEFFAAWKRAAAATLPTKLWSAPCPLPLACSCAEGHAVDRRRMVAGYLIAGAF
jgi:hypothetical protein